MTKAFRTVIFIIGLVLGVLLSIKVGASDERASYFLCILFVTPITACVYLGFVEACKGWEFVGAVLGALFVMYIFYYFILLVIVICQAIFGFLRLLL